MHRNKAVRRPGWEKKPVAGASGRAKSIDLSYPEARKLLENHDFETATEFFRKVGKSWNNHFGRTAEGSVPIAIDLLKNLGTGGALEFVEIVKTPKRAKSLIEKIGYEGIRKNFAVIKKLIEDGVRVPSIVKSIGK